MIKYYNWYFISKFYKSLRAIYVYLYILYIYTTLLMLRTIYIYAWQYKSNEHVNQLCCTLRNWPIDFQNHICPFSSIYNRRKKILEEWSPLYKNLLLKRCCMSSHVVFTVMIKCNDWLLCYSHICLHIVHSW